MRRTAWSLGLLAVLLAGLVVIALPGATSASTAPAPPGGAAAASLDPMLIDVSLAQLLRRDDAALLDALGVDPVPPPSYFQNTQIVGVYGYPGWCVMGELGCHDADGAARVALQLARRYDAANGDRHAIAALHLIVAVAQASAGADGTFLTRMPLDEIARYAEAARTHGLLLFLDVQVGWSDPLVEVQRLRPLLQEPFVHLALDPEFATRARGAAPGEVIGTLDAAQVNPVQAYLAALARLHRLPPKILVLHQFQPEMLTNKAAYANHAEVEITVDMDGFGSSGAKLSGYDAYARVGTRYSAFKLFYHWDEPLLTPEELLALPHPPDYVIYQ